MTHPEKCPHGRSQPVLSREELLEHTERCVCCGVAGSMKCKPCRTTRCASFAGGRCILDVGHDTSNRDASGAEWVEGAPFEIRPPAPNPPTPAISLLDYFASCDLNGLLAHGNGESAIAGLAALSYGLAEAMLAERALRNTDAPR